MSVTRLGDWVSVDCLFCGEKKLFHGRAILAEDHPANQSEMEVLVRCHECGKDTKIVKMPGQPPIYMPGVPSDWKEEPPEHKKS